MRHFIVKMVYIKERIINKMPTGDYTEYSQSMGVKRDTRHRGHKYEK